MPTLKVKDSDSNDIYIKMASGAGTSGDPYVPEQSVVPASLSVTLDGASITTDTAYTDKRWLKAKNTHGSANVTVTVNSLTKTLAPGEEYETPKLDRGESYPSISVNAASSSADVEFINV